MAKQKALGRGVGALIRTTEISNPATIKKEQIEHPNRSNTYEVIDIEIGKISVNPLQPRKIFDNEKISELKKSLITFGLLNPISVKETMGGYELVAGERRFRASQLAGFKTIPAIITNVSSDAEQLEKALIENIHRENLNPMEIAHSYNQLMLEFNYTQEQLAERLGMPRATIANVVRLLKLPDTVQKLVMEEKITLGHSKVLLSLDDNAAIITVANDVLEKGLSVRATEQIVRKVLDNKIMLSKGMDGTMKKIKDDNQPQLIATEEQTMIEYYKGLLRDKLSTKVDIFHKKNNISVLEIEFYNNEDLVALIKQIVGEN